MMKVVVTTGAIIHAILQSYRHHKHPTFFTGRIPFLSLTNSVKALKGTVLSMLS